LFSFAFFGARRLLRFSAMYFLANAELLPDSHVMAFNIEGGKN
jgi:hypothetical protein